MKFSIIAFYFTKVTIPDFFLVSQVRILKVQYHGS